MIAPRDLTQPQMQKRVENALRMIEELESTYETVTVAELVSLRARTHGSMIAIDVFERGERATYSEMDRRSNSCARALRAFGLRKGERVGVMLPNRIEFPILWFALAKLGAVMVPIYMHYTQREVEYILSDTQATFAIVDETAWRTFSAMDPWPQDLTRQRVLLVGQPSATATTLDQLLKGVDDSPIEEHVRHDDLLNLQYTSGTTGFPKGCMLTHDYWGVCSYIYYYLYFQPFKRYLCWSRFCYMYGQCLLMTSYRQGGTLFLAEQIDSSRLMSWVEQHRIEWCALPRQIADAADDVPNSLKRVSRYDYWTADTIRRFREQFGVRGLSAYGMTEIGIGTYPDIEEMDESGSLGIRSPFRELRLVNDDGTSAAVGEVGELWVRGRGILKGYWNRPKANAECFEGEWFKTGDLFRRDELGFHWLVGRNKDVIRREADNIAALEVETIICELSEIADVAAVPVRDDKRGEEVKIYVELKEGLTPNDLPVHRILKHARARLAEYKVPRYIAFTPALPRTFTSNKVIKRELMNVDDPLAGTYDGEEKRWR